MLNNKAHAPCVGVASDALWLQPRLGAFTLSAMLKFCTIFTSRISWKLKTNTSCFCLKVTFPSFSFLDSSMTISEFIRKTEHVGVVIML
jgi:hypothetical protein